MLKILTLVALILAFPAAAEECPGGQVNDPIITGVSDCESSGLVVNIVVTGQGLDCQCLGCRECPFRHCVATDPCEPRFNVQVFDYDIGQPDGRGPCFKASHPSSGESVWEPFVFDQMTRWEAHKTVDGGTITISTGCYFHPPVTWPGTTVCTISITPQGCEPCDSNIALCEQY